MISTPPDVLLKLKAVFAVILNIMTSGQTLMICLLVLSSPIHINGHASTGSDDCVHERDERLVRKYNKEVAVLL